MPFPSACRRQPCPNLAQRNGLCADHLTKQQAARGTTRERGYGTDWELLRKYKLSVDPFCQIRNPIAECGGKIAVEVDHIIPISERPDLRLVLSNLQSACNLCHRLKTQDDIRARKSPHPILPG